MSDGRMEETTFKAKGTAHPGPTARWAGHGVRKVARGAAAEQPRVSAGRLIMWGLSARVRILAFSPECNGEPPEGFEKDGMLFRLRSFPFV